MNQCQKATRIRLFDFTSPQMRAFHLSWFAFFLCFFAWFGIAPLMPIVRAELRLTPSQVGWCVIASVAATILVRPLMGWLCDRIGPRLAYTWLLLLGSLPVMGIGLAHDFSTLLVFRFLIGAIGGSFVITQYHTSQMFAANCIGTANATTAGWGNLGGGVTQFTMPLLLAFLVGVVGLSDYWGWRWAMFVAGLLCFGAGIAYYFLTQDTPEGNFARLRAEGRMPPAGQGQNSLLLAARDHRVWSLFAAYAACFGVELTIKNVAALYFTDYFELGLRAAGFAAGGYGLMNLFARTLGGWISDRCGISGGLRGRVRWLVVALAAEACVLVIFSQMRVAGLAVAVLVLVGLCVQMANGATYSLVPFVNPRCLGSVAGIVGAGGNVGAVAFGFLFQGTIAWPTALAVLAGFAAAASALVLLADFSDPARLENIGAIDEMPARGASEATA